MRRALSISAAMLLSACGGGGSKFAELPEGDPARARRADFHGTSYEPDVMVSTDGAVRWVQSVVSDYDRVSAEAGDLKVVMAPPSNCRFPRPAATDLVRHVIVERGAQPAPIYQFSRQEIGERAAKFAENYAASKGRNKKSLSREDADVARVTNVIVTETAQPVYLVLSSETNVVWNILRAPGVKISNIALVSSGAAGVANAPEGAVVNIIAGDAIKSCKMPQPTRRPQDHWGLVKGARKRDGGNLKEALETNRELAADYSQWLEHSFGVASEANAVAEMALSNALVGPAPSGVKVAFHAINEAPVLISKSDYLIVSPMAGYRQAHDEIVMEAARSDPQQLISGPQS